MTFPEFADDLKPLTVSEVTSDIKSLLEEAFPQLCVEGEISGYKKQASGHVYLTLKDETAVLPVVMWRSHALRLRFEPKNGMQVAAIGRLSVYDVQGRYQLYADRMIAQGEGALDLAFRKLKEKLFELGYFDPARKRPAPVEPKRIGVVTSPTGAAIRDILETLGRRWPAAEVVLAPVRVQGDGAAEEIAEAIQRFNQLHESGRLPFDVLLVGRGGGSIEDLWAFNERPVADAIFDSTIPVVSGVGHETDLTIADLVADVRALTPTAAAVAVTPDRLELATKVHAATYRLKDGLLRRLDRAWQKLVELRQRQPFRNPLDRTRELGRRLDELGERIHRRRPLERIREIDQQLIRWRERCDRAIHGLVDRSSIQIAGYAARLQALSPLAVLSRGYSLTSLESGAIVRSVSQVRPGETVTTRLPDGRFTSRIQSVQPAPSEGTAP